MPRYSVVTPRKKVYQVCISETDAGRARCSEPYLLTASPPGEKTAASQDQAWQTGVHSCGVNVPNETTRMADAGTVSKPRTLAQAKTPHAAATIFPSRSRIVRSFSLLLKMT
jgi:hypothetical protein